MTDDEQMCIDYIAQTNCPLAAFCVRSIRSSGENITSSLCYRSAPAFRLSLDNWGTLVNKKTLQVMPPERQRVPPEATKGACCRAPAKA